MKLTVLFLQPILHNRVDFKKLIIIPDYLVAIIAGSIYFDIEGVWCVQVFGQLIEPYIETLSNKHGFVLNCQRGHFCTSLQGYPGALQLKTLGRSCSSRWVEPYFALSGFWNKIHSLLKDESDVQVLWDKEAEAHPIRQEYLRSMNVGLWRLRKVFWLSPYEIYEFPPTCMPSILVLLYWMNAICPLTL